MDTTTLDPEDHASATPATGLIEIPVLVDPEGRAWALPTCRVVPGAAGADLVETTQLPPALRDAVVESAIDEARRLAAGAHSLTFSIAAGSAPRREGTPLDGWALAEELLGTSLDADSIAAALAAPPTGHAVEARLRAPDAPEGARLEHLRLPVGPGIRVIDSAVVGDAVGSAPVLRVVATGRSRGTALRRMHDALRGCAVVVEGAATNRPTLLAAVGAQLGGPRAAPPAADPLAVLVAAVRASDTQRAIDRASFHARAARGRPEAVAGRGVTTTLVHHGRSYEVVVHETGPGTYRIDTGEHTAELAVTRANDHEWDGDLRRAAAPCRAGSRGTGCVLEIDGIAHSVGRDEGIPVRADWPALIVSVTVEPGADVQLGDPLLVVEAMKMESTIRAPFAGTVTAVDVLPNAQVDAGAAMVRIRPHATAAEWSDERPSPTEARDDEQRLTFAGLALADTSGRPPFDRVYAALSSYVLGYELDPAALRSLLAEQRSFGNRTSAGDPDLLAAEDAFLDLYSELGLLWQTDRDPAGATTTGALAGGVTSAREYLMGYVQWLDPDRVGLPDGIRRRLARVLSRYGVADLHRNPTLEDAVVRLFESQARMPQLTGVVAGILERRMRFRDRVQPLQGADAGRRYDRLTAAAQGQIEAIADLARDARFRLIDEPVIEAGRAELQAEMEAHLEALSEDPRRADRAARITALVECPQPMRELLLRRRLAAGADPDMQAALLEVRARRWYRIRELRDLRVVDVDGVQLCCADYDFDRRSIHVVLALTPVEDLERLGRAIAAHLADVDPDRAPVIDVMSWRTAAQPNGDDLSAELGRTLSGWDLGRAVWRIDATVSSLAADADPENRTQYFTYRPDAQGGLAEDTFYRNLHPMLAKRLELWRLGNFELTRLPSLEDVYLFHGVARDNPKDHRLFALAEVRDMTPLPQGRGGVTIFPMLERMGLQSIIAMRRARAGFPERGKPQANRITLFVRPPWTVPPEHWSDLAEMMVPLAGGAGLELVVIRTSIPEPDGSLRPTVLNVDGIIQRSVTVTEEPPRDDVVRPLTRYRQKVLTAQRFGVPYPFEILRMFAPPPGTVGKFKPAHFASTTSTSPARRWSRSTRARANSRTSSSGCSPRHRCLPRGHDPGGHAVGPDPRSRQPGRAGVPPGQRRVGAWPPSVGVPVEWFAVSAGALISMESGTENMDWIALTLRRIIEFTQAGGEINVIVTGINVGGQPYWNAEATMLHAHPGHPGDDPDERDGADRQAGAGLLRRRVRRRQLRHRRLRPGDGSERPGAVLGRVAGDACEVLLRHYELHLRRPRRAVPPPHHDE